MFDTGRNGQGGTRTGEEKTAARAWWWRYGLALSSVALAALLTGAMYRLLGVEQPHAPFALFFVAVLFSTLYGGRRAGLLASVLSGFVGAYLFIPPFYSLTVSADALQQACIFLVAALTINYLAEKNSRADEKLRRRERELSDFIENATVGLHWVAGDGTILWANRAELEMLGYSREEYVGHHIAEFHADDETINDILGRLTRGETIHNREARLRCKNGTIRYGLINSNVLWEDGKFVHTRCFTRDITERKLAEEALRESEERFRALAAIVESSDDAIIGKTLDGVITSWNPGAEKIYGYTAGEIIGRPISILVPPERPDEMPNVLERLKRGEQIDHYETVRIAKDGRLLGVALTISPIKDRNGQITGASTITRDITGRKQIEKALTQSEQQYRYLADSMPQIVWTARPDGFFDYYNARWYDYTGMTREQTEGWGWQPVLHPDDVEHCLRRWSTSVTTGEPYQIEYRFKRASDGAYRWHLGRALPVRNAEGQIVKWFGTATDIDDQKRTEESLRFLSEADAVLASSLEYEVTLATLAGLVVPRLADWCAVDMLKPDGTLQRLAVEHIDPAKVEMAREIERRYQVDLNDPEGLPKALRTGRREFYPEISDDLLAATARDAEHLKMLRDLRLKSGLIVPLVARGRTLGAITLVMAESGRRYTERDLVLAEDLSRRAAMAIDNAQLYRRTEETNRSKDEFLATLSHELRTPLTPVIGWVHMMRGGQLPKEESRRGLAVIDRNAQSLARLINDLLDMSAIMSGKMRIDRAPVDLEAMLREAVETARAEADRRGVEISFEFTPCADAQPRYVSGDRTRLAQVFWNLLNNAVKFSGKGGRVRLTCETEGGEVRVRVEDDGIGIAPEFLPQVFERFRQADASTTRTYGGLGIGLALVKSFVEAHGGAVTAASEGKGRGSRFTVTLPLLRRRGARYPKVSADDFSSASPVPRATPDVRRVLLVEDARDTLEMLRALFEGRGFETALCETAAEALRVASSTWFDIIVSDIGLPHLDGYELIRRLRRMAHLRNTPAVALTGYASPKDAESALLAGFDVHIPKPVDPIFLANAVERLLVEKPQAKDAPVQQ